MLEAQDQIRRFQDFFEEVYKTKVVEAVSRGKNFVVLDFSDLIKHDPELAEDFLNNPEETLKAAEISIEQLDIIEGRIFRIRLSNLPSNTHMLIRNIRSSHLGKLHTFEGIVRQKSDVRPQVVASKFECPACGQVISVLQVDTNFREPTKCGCGRKGRFNLLSKDMVDAQGIVLEESSEMLEGGAQPKRINIFLKEDLVSPISEKRTNPGSKIKVVGLVKEIPFVLKSGGKSTRFDLLIEANNVEAVEESFYDIEVSQTEVEKIKELSKDPNIYDKMINSLAPSIYGYSKTKEALILQLMGGVQKKRTDGMVSRGDIHVLLVGDPGSGKCLHGDTRIICADGSIKPIRELVESNAKECIEDSAYVPSAVFDVIALNEDAKSGKKKVTLVWKRKSPKKLIKIYTGSGNEVLVTENHPFFVTKNGIIYSKQAHELSTSDFIATPRKINIEGKEQIIEVNDYVRSKARNSRKIRVPDKVDEKIARLFGYLVGDGYVSYSSTSGWISLTNNDEIVLQDFCRIMEERFNAKVTRRAPHKGKSAKEVYSTSIEIVRILEAIEPSITKGAWGKRIPSIINKSPNKILRSFLQALFECDGHVNKKKACIEFASASKNLIFEIKANLLRFGIISFVHKKSKFATNTEKKTRRTYYEIIIYGDNFDRFCSEIGFLGKKKDDAEIVLKQSKKHNTNTDIIPNMSVLLKALREEMFLLQRDFEIPRTTYMHYERGDRHPSRESLKRVAQKYKTLSENMSLFAKVVEDISDADVFWDKIKKIKWVNADEEYVYDLQVEETHNYVANAIVVHNSQLLKRISQIAPKGRYVSGKGVSGAGLTAAVVKDEFLGGWSLEAGALVLANNGICCIDEMDKMSNEDRAAMHEALEQQSISIAKANIQATLLARTTVLAAANPHFGRFDPYGIIAEQINLPPTLINRFDLIFPIKDMPDEGRDERMAKHILNLHQTPDVGESEIDTNLLKKYVVYARQNIFPKLTNVALNEIKDFYVKMRNMGSADEKAVRAVPISARQLEALVRLAEASARVRLDDKVKREDAQRAIKLLTYCLLQIGIDKETGEIDIDRITTGITASQRNKIVLIKDLIIDLSKKFENKLIPVEEVMAQATSKGLKESEVEHILHQLNKNGEIYEPRHGFIQKL